MINTVASEMESMGVITTRSPLELIYLMDYYKNENNDGFFVAKDKSLWSFFEVSGVDSNIYGPEYEYAVIEYLHKEIVARKLEANVHIYRHRTSDIKRPISKLIADSRNDDFSHALTSALSSHFISAADSKYGLQYILKKDSNKEDENIEFNSKLSKNNYEATNGMQTCSIRLVIAINKDISSLDTSDSLSGGFSIASALGINNKKEQKSSVARQSIIKFMAQRNTLNNILSSPKSGMTSLHEMNGDDMVDFLYGIINPVRAKMMPAPSYTSDMGIAEAIEALCGEISIMDGINKPSENIPAASVKSNISVTGSGVKIDSPGLAPYYYESVYSHGFGNASDNYYRDLMNNLSGDNLLCISLRPTYGTSVSLKFALLLQIKRQFHRTLADAMKVPGLKTLYNQEKFEKKDSDLSYAYLATNEFSGENRQFSIDMSVSVFVGGTNKTDTAKRAFDCQSLLQLRGIKESKTGGALFALNIPGNYREMTSQILGKSTRLISGHAFRGLPLMGSFKGSKSSAIPVTNRSGEVVFIDLFEKDETRTGHSLVVGGTGVGKSFLVNYIVFNTNRRYKLKLWVIDKGASFVNSIESMGGSYQRVNTGSIADEPLTCFNVFHSSGPESDSEKTGSSEDLLNFNSLNEKAIRIMTDIEVMVKSMTGEARFEIAEQNILSGAIVKYLTYLDGREGTMEEFITKFVANENGEAGKKLAGNFSMFIGGGIYSSLVNGHSTLDWTANAIGVDIAAASDKVLPFVMQMLFGSIYVYCVFKLPTAMKKLVVIDEAWKALAVGGSISTISGYYREFRKFNAAVMLISQTIIEFIKLIKSDSADDTDGILANLSHYFLLPANDADYAASVEDLGFHPLEAQAWANLSGRPPFYQEVFYRRKMTNDRYTSAIFRVTAPALVYWLSTSDGDDKDYLKKRTDDFIALNYSREKAVIFAAKDAANEYPGGIRKGKAKVA